MRFESVLHRFTRVAGAASVSLHGRLVVRAARSSGLSGNHIHSYSSSPSCGYRLSHQLGKSRQELSLLTWESEVVGSSLGTPREATCGWWVPNREGRGQSDGRMATTAALARVSSQAAWVKSACGAVADDCRHDCTSSSSLAPRVSMPIRLESRGSQKLASSSSPIFSERKHFVQGSRAIRSTTLPIRSFPEHGCRRSMGARCEAPQSTASRDPPAARAAETLEKAKEAAHIPYVAKMSNKNILRNLSVAELYEQAIGDEDDNFIVSSGALATLSGEKTGRSPKDKRVVKDEEHQHDLWWGKGSPNIAMDQYTFMANRETAVAYLNSLDKVYVNDMFIGWDPEFRVKVRIVASRAYHSLFMHNMCIRPTQEELDNFGEPDFVIYNAGKFPVNRLTPGMTSATSVDIDLRRMEMVILGTQYAGEMKKGLFSLMNYMMPKRGVLSLHSGCNMSADGDVSLFFGLSGTGKTTLSTDPNRLLIGDDEHCWSDNGIFNIEGGCYAKCIDLSKEGEPDIYNAIRFGAVLENVVFDPHTREVDFTDGSITENTRASYPINYIHNAKVPCVGPHPKNVILLTCDAFGVLPPVSKLTLEQTMYHFISGYTAKVAGTEVGVTEPEATFSSCFGAAFIMWHPTKYASMLAERMQRHGAQAWLVNTGWTGGSYGEGHRMKLSHTRAIIDAIHDGSLKDVACTTIPIFNLQAPVACKGVPPEILNPVNQWKDKDAYHATLKKLGQLFSNNFEKFEVYEAGGETRRIDDRILKAGPQLK
ncbi:hypothetical protein CBR_g38782 [Chara braunii]|uniref:phosphoenolpyruvate carboxykinase (ATP) n=1 Tax=Chara braunii TaxID=69332 RepID=A0A388LQ80_CHABU|nr:hypothetical protein CBR_g38782 [Chara braunii]|eukprot:GBG84500.1 hypothetical protein CBR_g38782 [Chara braunii]